MAKDFNIYNPNFWDFNNKNFDFPSFDMNKIINFVTGNFENINDSVAYLARLIKGINEYLTKEMMSELDPPKDDNTDWELKGYDSLEEYEYENDKFYQTVIERNEYCPEPRRTNLRRIAIMEFQHKLSTLLIDIISGDKVIDYEKKEIRKRNSKIKTNFSNQLMIFALFELLEKSEYISKGHCKKIAFYISNNFFDDKEKKDIDRSYINANKKSPDYKRDRIRYFRFITNDLSKAFQDFENENKNDSLPDYLLTEDEK